MANMTVSRDAAQQHTSSMTVDVDPTTGYFTNIEAIIDKEYPSLRGMFYGSKQRPDGLFNLQIPHTWTTLARLYILAHS